MGIARTYWRYRCGHWPAGQKWDRGYSLALPVPGDLPVFVDLALSICAGLGRSHRVEVLVIPDSHARATKRLVAAKPDLPAGPIRVVPIPAAEAAALRLRPNPFITYGLQFLTAAKHARASHVVMHDADLFALEPDMVDGLFSECVDRDLACLGVNPVWDSWFADKRRTIAATWEMTYRVEWARKFPPYLHMPRVWDVDGEDHSFDISLYPQYMTPQSLIGLSRNSYSFIHFNHVIGTYRGYQRARGAFTDKNFRILLIRLLSECRNVDTPTVPTMQDLVKGLTDKSRRVTFEVADASSADTYGSFKAQVGAMLTHPVFNDQARDRALQCLVPFDRYFG